jgi:hypothetical protein
MSRRNALFDIYCVLHSAADIASRAAQIQARNSYIAFRDQIPTRRNQPAAARDHSRPDAEPRVENPTQNMTEEPVNSLDQSTLLNTVAEDVVSADTAVEPLVDLNAPKNEVQTPRSPSPQTRIIEEPSYLLDHTIDVHEVLAIKSIPGRILFS